MAEFTIEQAFNLALQQHQAGQLVEAEQLYRLILGQQPDHFNALHLLGILALNSGHAADAVNLISRALQVMPDFAEAHNNLGSALASTGQLDAAIQSFLQAVALRPDVAEAYNNLGNALKDTGKLDESIAAYQQAISLRPTFAEAHNNLGTALKSAARLDEAMAAYRQAIANRPDYAEAHSNLGTILQDKKEVDAAIDSYRRAISLNPNYAQGHYNVGNLLRDNGQLDEAITAYRQAVDLNPNFIDAFKNLGYALGESGKPQEAVNAFEHAIKLKPDLAAAHFGLAMVLLLQGDFQRGLPEYEWRWQCEWLSRPRNFSQPQYDGSSPGGRTLLIYAEQGFGDSLQFVRYAILLARQGGKIILECRPELVRLFNTLEGDFQIVPQGQPLPQFDVQCALASLPMIFRTRLDSIPAEIPYVFPDAMLQESWREKLHLPTDHLKVAISWAGNPDFPQDSTRSITLDRLAPLAAVTGVTFYSIQKGPAAKQPPPAGLRLINLSDQLHDFTDTAAVMSLMDLILTTDTSVAHLAGALGRPVWVMLQFMPDWRWLLDRNDSPWYPTMRLFRQPKLGDWDSVIARVVHELDP